MIELLTTAEMAKADSAMAKTFSQSWKWSHLIVDHGSQEQQRRYFDAFVAASETEFFVHTRLRGVRNFELKTGKAGKLTNSEPVLDGLVWVFG